MSSSALTRRPEILAPAGDEAALRAAVRAAVDGGRLSGREKLGVVVSLKIEKLGLAETIDGAIELE